MRRHVGLRWTIGDVSDLGWDALRLSILGAWQAFGPDTAYAVCVNSVPLERARALLDALPTEVTLISSTRERFPPFLTRFLDAGMAEGVAWKFAPLRVFPDRWELALDNDCILWRRPAAIDAWLSGPDDGVVIAEDVRACFGRFAALSGDAPRNSGIRGLPPGFDLEEALVSVLEAGGGVLTSELDEQGLQVAAVSRGRPPNVVTVDEVSICSPTPPHRSDLGSCGVHFVGLNARRLPWTLEGVPAHVKVAENYARLRPLVARHVGLPS